MGGLVADDEVVRAVGVVARAGVVPPELLVLVAAMAAREAAAADVARKVVRRPPLPELARLEEELHRLLDAERRGFWHRPSGKDAPRLRLGVRVGELADLQQVPQVLLEQVLL